MSQWHYPLDWGNQWEYWDAFPPPEMYAWTTRVAGDTLMPNGISYSILRSDLTWKDEYQRSLGLLVYSYDPFDSTEWVLYDFSKKVGDTISIRTTPNDTLVTTVSDDYYAEVFGRTLRVKEFYERPIWTSFYVIRTVADSLGLIRMTYEPSEGGQLVGAVIAGTKYGDLTGVSSSPAILPPEVFLRQNYPNPFNPSTAIEFYLPHSGFVSINVVNMLGQEVANLLSDRRDAGWHHVTWNAYNMPSGIYFYTLSIGQSAFTKHMILIR